MPEDTMPEDMMPENMQVAIGDWFAREKITDEIWRLWEPFADPFARCNIWFVRGRDRALLVDTGLGVASLHEAARDLFEHPTLALATHYHFDHTGSLHEFSERLAHKAGVSYLATPGAIGGALRRDAFPAAAVEMYVAAGYDLPESLLDALPYTGYDPGGYVVESCNPTRVLDDGDIIDLGDRAFEVLHLPGHSPDSIGLWVGVGYALLRRRGLRRPAPRREFRLRHRRLRRDDGAAPGDARRSRTRGP